MTISSIHSVPSFTSAAAEPALTKPPAAPTQAAAKTDADQDHDNTANASAALLNVKA